MTRFPRSVSDYQKLQRQFDDLLQHIRSLEVFRHFLQGLSESELRSLANDHTIVVLNVSAIRNDAFLITADAIRILHLHSFSGSFIFDLTKSFLEAITQSNDLTQTRSAIKKIDSVLKNLWDHAVNPILQALGFTQTPVSEMWPRVWWVRSGILSVLPFHAAGYHNSNPPRSTLDRVISSIVDF